MSDKRKKPGMAFWVTVALVLVVVGYPLSIGPAFLLADQGVVPRDFGRLYTPIAWLGEKSERIAGVLEWYLRLWVELDIPDAPPDWVLPETVPAP